MQIHAIQESPGPEFENDASITFSMDDSLSSDIISRKPSFEKAVSEVSLKFEIIISYNLLYYVTFDVKLKFM